MPKNISRIYFRDYFSRESEPSVRAYFGRVRVGQPKVYDTPFAKGETTSTLLKKWMEILVSVRSNWPTLWKFEKDLAEKVGPLSVMKPLSERMTDIDHYYEGIHLPSTPIMNRAVSAVISEWRLGDRIQVRDMGRTVQNMKLSTNSGNPYFARRRKVVGNTIPCEIHPYKQYLNMNLAGNNWLGTAILGWRGQEGGPKPGDVKQRVVWMFPFSVNIRELQVYQPLIEYAQRYNIVPAWVSMEQVDKEITNLFDTKNSNDLIVCTDFSKFDQHFNADMQDVARSVLANILRANKTTLDWLTNVFPVKYSIPLLIDNQRLVHGNHGMGSGSGGTNADETIAHRALQYEAAMVKGARLNPHSMCLGDDGILSYPGITVDDVVEVYTSHGQEMNEIKQYASTQDCVYLRRWHHKDYRIGGVCAGVYSTCRALGRMRYLERYYDPEVWGPKAVALRQLSILENVKYHPLRMEFAHFCMERDKYRLGIDIPGFLDNIEVEARRAIDQMPDFLGYTKTLQSLKDPTGGIADWWIVKYLKSLA